MTSLSLASVICVACLCRVCHLLVMRVTVVADDYSQRSDRKKTHVLFQKIAGESVAHQKEYHNLARDMA